MFKRTRSTPAATPHRSRGIVVVLLAIGMLAIVGMAGLAIDVGHGFTNKSRLQNALDAAALSGMRTVMLTRDKAAANVDARQAFTEHLAGEMDSLDATAMTIEYSSVLTAAFNDNAEPFYIRVGYSGFNTDYTFASLLPGVQGAMDIGGTAVAGAIPVGNGGGAICDLAPILMCGVPGDDDCSDGYCFGVEAGAEVEHQLKQAVSEGGQGGGEGGGGNGQDVCPGDGYYGCIPPDESGEIGPGNFQLIRLGGNGGDVVRDNLAGGYQGCLTNTSQVETEPGNTVGPTSQGVNTRFNIYNGPVSPGDYPPDIVVTNRDDDRDFWHDDYQTESAAIIAAGSGGVPGGVPGRRKIVAPVVECNDDENGQSQIDVLGFACFFLTRPAGGTGQSNFIYGQLLKGDEGGCEASGDVGPTSDPNTDFGKYKLVLYKDPSSPDS